MSAPGTVGGCSPSTAAVATTATSLTAATAVSPPASAAALRAAAARGDLTTCQRLLGPVRCVRFSRDADGRSALHLAASGGHTAVVRLLLDVAAPREVDSPDGAGCTALQRAAADGHEEVVRLVLARGADIDRHDSMHANTALHEAAWKGYSRCVRLLSAAGASLSKSNAGGFTALHLCCQNGHNQSCRELLLAGCDPDIQNNYGDTALHTAARYGHAGVTRILISAQCRVSEQNKNGDTALHIAAAMGRRKLTRILLEAGCDRGVRNKQGETARDIALRKNLSEILEILDECYQVRSGKERKSSRSNKKNRSKSKVRFEGKHGEDVVDNVQKPKHWSPYGCHYFPDPEAFPSPRLDSLPQEPLKRGEQYYLDLAGNICKGPVSVGYTCYCAPLFKHLEARLERDKRELQRAQFRLGQRVAGLEQKLNRGQHGRRSERVLATSTREPELLPLPRSRSLEMLDELDKPAMQTTRSMDELEGPIENDTSRPSVKELVARIQQQTSHNNTNDNNSESSDDEPLRISKKRGTMGDSNIAPLSSFSDVPVDIPRSRSGVYSPTIINTALVDHNIRYVDPTSKIQDTSMMNYTKYSQPSTSKVDPRYHHQEMRFVDNSYKVQFYENDPVSSPKYYDNNLNSRLAKLRVLESSKVYDGKRELEGPSRVLETNFGPQSQSDNADRDTNNDSGYSTKVYGSSKGNSPSLSGQIDGECMGASSLV